MNKRDFYIQIFVFLMWIVIVSVTGFNHEPWADEAQAWLIARDNSCFDIIKLLKYEGHPALWYFILKIFTSINMPYELFYIIPVILSGFGVFLLLFKTKLPLIIKILFPFTFYILYQNAVIARSYVLLLPLLMLIAINYQDRLKKPLKYTIFLILLLSSETYSYIISVILFLFFLYDVIAAKQIDKKTVFSVLLFITTAISTFLYLKLPSDYFLAIPSFGFSLKNLCLTFLNGYFEVDTNRYVLFGLLLLLTFYISAITLFCKNIRQILFFICMNFSIVLTISMMVGRYWHYGYIITVLIFSIAILIQENNETEIKKGVNIIFSSLLVFLSLIQILWSFNSISYDISNNYSSARNIAEFIKRNNLDKYKISALGYEPVAIQPYFKHNIYNNYQTSYYQFNIDFAKENDTKGQQAVPIIILDPAFYKFYDNFIQELKGYQIYTFNGSLRTKSEIDPAINMFVFVRNDIKI